MKLIIVLFLTSLGLFAQENTITFGLQFKPIIPSNFAKAGPQFIVEDGIELTLNQRTGYSSGMVIRKGLTEKFSFETGINFVRRNYNTFFEDKRIEIQDDLTFASVGYEIPILGLLYIRLTDRLYMNTAFGLSIDMYPSGIQGVGAYIEQTSLPRRWAQPALLANVGFENRTKESGIFYIGASLHRPFFYSYATRMTYVNSPYIAEVITKIYGSYFTLDFRYFFHEDPEKKKKKKKN